MLDSDKRQIHVDVDIFKSCINFKPIFKGACVEYNNGLYCINIFICSQ